MHNINDLQKLLKLIATEKAILFVGAGFSINSKNLRNEKIPLTKELAIKICDEILNESLCEEIEDLTEAAENAILLNQQNKLIDVLQTLFTIKEVNFQNKIIIELPWRRIYTTNYDNVIEKGGNEIGLNYYPAISSESPDIISKKEKICFHINGYIQNLTTETLNDEFKLTSSSYLKQDPLYETPWGDVFRKDIQFASAIIFIGYSLYDYAVEKLLYEHKEQYKNKIYFILEEEPKQRDVLKLNRYGKILKIGVSGFAGYVKENITIVKNYKNIMESDFEAFKEFDAVDEIRDISHDEIRNFLTYGKYDKNYICAGLSKDYKNFIHFAWIDKLLDEITNLQNGFFHINGELGTGKSVGLEILASKLLIERGEKVFFLKNKYGDYIEDIKKIIKLNIKIYLIIDNVEEGIDVLKYLYTILTSEYTHEIIVLSSGRKYIGAYGDIFNKATNFSISEFLNDNEKEKLINMIKNIGAEKQQRLNILIEREHNNSLPNFLLDFIQSKVIAENIKSEFNKLLDLNHGKYKKTLMALCLVGMLQKEIDFYIIKTLTNQDFIRDTLLLNNESFQNFFKDENGNLIIRSSIFTRYILQKLFLDHIKKEYFLEFVKVADEKKFTTSTDDSYFSLRFESIFKELVKYYSLSRVFQNDETILSYFEQVKNELYWLDSDPNYWIQLALLNLERKKIDIAYDMILTARDRAEKKLNYKYDYINTVEARYQIEKALSEKHMKVKEVYELFIEADTLLKKVKPSDNKYRQISKYIYIYELFNNKDFFNRKNQDDINSFIKKIKNQYNEILKVEDSNYEGINKIYLVNLSKINLEKILTALEDKNE